MIIDDTYNSSPAAATLAIETLGSLEIRGKRIAVLGDMLELGSHGEAAHTNLGDETAKVADVIITVGDMGRLIAEGALDAGFPREKLAHFENSKEASKEIAKYLSSGDLVLVKGSQGMRMEYIVKEIIIDQSQSSELLVRQDKDWLAKK
jgi:UDP-N-acetylmuramoyl-tripeptide--D-alanyl-D-alanine ligase